MPWLAAANRLTCNQARRWGVGSAGGGRPESTGCAQAAVLLGSPEVTSGIRFEQHCPQPHGKILESEWVHSWPSWLNAMAVHGS